MIDLRMIDLRSQAFLDICVARQSTDVYIKTAVSNVCASVVTLTSDAAGDLEDLYRPRVNGTIFSCIPDDEYGAFVSYILTSADLLRRCGGTREKLVFPVTQIVVRRSNNKSYEGEVVACDKHYNIAVIKIKSDVPLQAAILQPFSDFISVSPREVSERPSPFTCPSKLTPGDEVIVVCRTLDESCDVAVWSGCYSLDYIVGSNIKELYKIEMSCNTFMEGAPVINSNGNVLGVASHGFRGDAFLPVNVFLKWWNQVLTYGEICRPSLGMSVANLFTAPLHRLEPIVHDCNISDGVIVEEVARGSPADFANICTNDVICECDGRSVRSCMEFYELIWDKSGKVVEVKGVRGGSPFVWELEVEAIKTKILPDILTDREESTKSGKNKAKGRKEMKSRTWSLRRCTTAIKLKDVVLSRNSKRKRGENSGKR